MCYQITSAPAMTTGGRQYLWFSDAAKKESIDAILSGTLKSDAKPALIVAGCLWSALMN